MASPTADDHDTDEPTPQRRREDDPDPAVRAGGPFGGGDPGEADAWAKAFSDAAPADADPPKE